MSPPPRKKPFMYLVYKFLFPRFFLIVLQYPLTLDKKEPQIVLKIVKNIALFYKELETNRSG